MHTPAFKVGDPVIFRVTKHTAKPGPRAAHIDPDPKGEGYTYDVDKFWVVAEARADGKLVLRTRRGKEHVIDGHSERLRRPHWWERLLYRRKFPAVSS